MFVNLCLLSVCLSLARSFSLLSEASSFDYAVPLCVSVWRFHKYYTNSHCMVTYSNRQRVTWCADIVDCKCLRERESGHLSWFFDEEGFLQCDAIQLAFLGLAQVFAAAATTVIKLYEMEREREREGQKTHGTSEQRKIAKNENNNSIDNTVYVCTCSVFMHSYFLHFDVVLLLQISVRHSTFTRSHMSRNCATLPKYHEKQTYTRYELTVNTKIFIILFYFFFLTKSRWQSICAKEEAKLEIHFCFNWDLQIEFSAVFINVADSKITTHILVGNLRSINIDGKKLTPKIRTHFIVSVGDLVQCDVVAVLAF